jgi:hypothetical protein
LASFNAVARLLHAFAWLEQSPAPELVVATYHVVVAAVAGVATARVVVTAEKVAITETAARTRGFPDVLRFDRAESRPNTFRNRRFIVSNLCAIPELSAHCPPT